jgi:hypothetical protein
VKEARFAGLDDVNLQIAIDHSGVDGWGLSAARRRFARARCETALL